MRGQPQLCAPVDRLAVEAAMRTVVASNRLIQVIAPVGADRLVALLAVECLERQFAIKKSGNHAGAEYRLDRRPSDPQFTTTMRGGPVHAARRDLRLEYFAQ